MKRMICMVLAVALLLGLTACAGNMNQVDLHDTVKIPGSGIISADVIEQLKQENAIGTFEGSSNGLTYRWTVFARDVETVAEANLALTLEKKDGVLYVTGSGEALPFPAHLSIYLDEKWVELRAVAFEGEQEVCQVTITGEKESILNLFVEKALTQWVIRPEGEDAPVTEAPEQTPTEPLPTEPQPTDPQPTDPQPTDPQPTDPQPTDPKPTTPKPTDPKPTEPAPTVKPTNPTAPTDDREISDGSGTGQDDYKTDPVPEGKPLPVEPEDAEIDKSKVYTCTFSIECSTILNNLSDLDPDKLELVPSTGVILAPLEVTFYDGESVFDVLQRVCREYNIHMEASWTPMYNSAYVEGIANFYEFDCGEQSGWMYRVDGWYPNYGCSRYMLADGEVVEWRYTCKGLGADVGCEWMG